MLSNFKKFLIGVIAVGTFGATAVALSNNMPAVQLGGSSSMFTIDNSSNISSNSDAYAPSSSTPAQQKSDISSSSEVSSQEPSSSNTPPNSISSNSSQESNSSSPKLNDDGLIIQTPSSYSSSVSQVPSQIK
jgi:hypothetical protein